MTVAKNVQDERIRLIKAQAKKYELDVAIKQGGLLPYSEVVPAWQRLVMAFRSKALGLGSKLSAQLVGKTAHEIKEYIDEEIRGALDELSGFDLCKDKTGNPRSRANGKTTTKAYVKRVGRSVRLPLARVKRRAR